MTELLMETHRPERRQFDFWVGDWDCVWESGTATNRVTSELGGTAILERFDARTTMPFWGMSISVFDAERGEWRQTWVDSDGRYLDFAGGLADGVMVLRSPTHRMRWTDIERDSLTWYWEQQTGDDTWDLLWRLDYTRRAV